jgi:phosphoenolpyruvate---glycerone phosphotransferase subunit DhaL
MSGIGPGEICHWFIALGQSLTKYQDLLDDLDSGAGDGDHGATMVMGFRRVTRAMQQDIPTPAQGLKIAGRAFAGVGGSIGPLWGLGLLRAAQALPNEPFIDGADISAALLAAAAAAAEIGSARVGDRTLLDAMHPAVERFAESFSKTGDARTAALSGWEAALRGAAATATMTATRGRAARNPALAVGRVDPGAASVALAWTAAVRPDALAVWRSAIGGTSPPALR